MRKTALLLVVGICIAAAPVAAREFAKPYEAANPLAGVSPDAPPFLPASYADIGYRSHVISFSDHDLFIASTLGSSTFYHNDGRFAAGVLYGQLFSFWPICVDRAGLAQ